MSDPFKQFWAWVMVGTTFTFGLLATGQILKNQQGAVNILGATGTFISTDVGALRQIGS